MLLDGSNFGVNSLDTCAGGTGESDFASVALEGAEDES